MKVVHVITCLDQGGAEAVLFRLATSAFGQASSHTVISLQGPGFYGPKLAKHNVDVYTLDMPKGRVSLGGLVRLFSLMRRLRPDVVQTWMYHSDLIGGVVSRLAGIRNIVWGIRHANLDKDKNSRMTLLVAKACATLSRMVPHKIVCCSERAATVHEAVGYDASRFALIANGYDLSRFRSDPVARERIRAEWGIDGDRIVLGCVARWDVQKDHPNLLRALAILLKNGFDGVCVLVGPGMTKENERLVALVNELGVGDHVRLLGPRDDVPAVMNAFDVNVLSSSGEAFPNVLAEAMACEVPSVTTDVGDASMIVGDTGWVVEPQNSVALADGIAKAVADVSGPNRAARAARCRQRVSDEFQLSKMVGAYEAVWSSNRRPSALKGSRRAARAPSSTSEGV
ncbi:glycosyltransferase family 4 protein [Burkholderia sp. PU8-34]